MNAIHDPYVAGRAAGWRITDCADLKADTRDAADVVIVGSGAGGGVTAEILVRAGLSVIIVEEGPLRTTGDFHMREAEAYPQLYQESAARKTADKAITIMQGRCVGGSTTVNWASSFRTPASTLDYWERRWGLADLTAEALAPWFQAMEQRLHMSPWNQPPNENNGLLARGGAKLGIPVQTISRNVLGCWNLGYCGMGCPTGAKQSMLVTTLPAALAGGAHLYTRLRAGSLSFHQGRVRELMGEAMDARGVHPTGIRVQLRAKHFVVAGGAIGSPALLMRSGAPDPHGRLGIRTFLHPTVVSAAIMPEPVNGFSGAPQSLYSDHFLHTQPVEGPLGFKLEVPPLHPVLFATTTQGFGQAHRDLMVQMARSQVLIGLLRDGFHPDSPGGKVSLRDDGTPVLDYPLTDALFDGARRALAAMAEIQFAAGASKVVAIHESCTGWTDWPSARAGIAALPMVPLGLRVVSAHVMGGCAMGARPVDGVVDSLGRHFQLENLSIHDGSVFPTSIGANPQLSIYGLVARNATALAERLTGRAVPPAAT